MKNVLITGGLGYVGGRLADFLHRSEPSFRITLTTHRDNFTPFAWTRGMEVAVLDLLDVQSIVRTLSRGFDTVIHLASINALDSFEDIENTWEVNVKGTHRLLDEAGRAGVKRLIYFSTSHVYGVPSSKEITEDQPTPCSHPYASTHRAAEDIVRYFRDYRNMHALILRMSNGYGYPMDKNINRWELVFNDLCRQAMTSGKLVLRSSGVQHRDFIGLHDVCRAVHHFLVNIPGKWGSGLYNLGGGYSMSILDVANTVARVYEATCHKPIAGIETTPPQSYESSDPVRFNIDRLKNTGFRLESPMEYEIQKTLKTCREFFG